MKGQGSFEYIIILAVVIIIAFIIVSALSAFGIFDFRNKIEENTNEINNLLRDVSIAYAIKNDGYTQVGLRSLTSSKVIIHNFTIGGCLFKLNNTVLTTSWKMYNQNCSGLTGTLNDQYDYTCTLHYEDGRSIMRGETGNCYGFYEN